MMSSRDNNKVKKSIALSPRVKKRVDDAAMKEGRSFSNYVDRVLMKHFGLEEASTPLARSAR